MTQTPAGPRRRIHNHFDLQDLIDELAQPAELVERDFALVSIVAQIVQDFGDALCLKGGFVLRHVYGHERFSKDIDATRYIPPKNKLDAGDVADSVRAASMRNIIDIDPGTPKTDSGTSLDFDRITYRGPLGKGTVALEVSYREAIVETPDMASIGPPFYEPFDVPVMAINEIVAEKLRALSQRDRPTDLSDLAMIFERQADRLDDARIAELARKKFEIVRDGDRLARIVERVDAMASTYDQTVPGVAPDAPDYAAARDSVLRRIRDLVP